MNAHIKKVFGVVGSPRHGKNTGILVQKVVEGAKSKGIESVHLYINDFQINPCKACFSCKQTGECLQDDDMQTFYSALGETKVLVLGTPIYFDHVSAQTKLFLDRLYPYLGPDLEHRFPKGVKAVLILTWEDQKPNAYDNVKTWLQDRLSFYFDIETIEVIKAFGTGKTPVSKNSELLNKAFDIGVRLSEYFEIKPFRVEPHLIFAVTPPTDYG